MNFDNLKKTDKVCYDLVMDEMDRQEHTLELIPSECIASLSTIEALGTPFTNKYSEWYPGKRYYAGNEVVDKVEILAQDRAKAAFPGVAHVNVQPYSGSPANLAVYNAICDLGDTTLGLSLTEWGHLTHGWKVSATAKYFNPVLYWLDKDGFLDMDQVEALALEHKPKLIWCGTTAYSREVPYKRFAEIAKKVGAYLVADIAHISGLIIAGVHESPAPYVDLITTTTHKTMRGPRGGMIMVTEKWLKKDPDLAKKIDMSVFPGLQWGPHNHQILSVAVALGESVKPKFVTMNQQIVKNAKVLASELEGYGFDIATGGTDTHLVLAGVGKWRGNFMQEWLDVAGMSLNKNTVPNEPCSPFNPSGIRMWTPILTMRGMKEAEMKQVAAWMNEVKEIVSEFKYFEDKQGRLAENARFNASVYTNPKLLEIKKQVKVFCEKFPIYQ